MSNHLGEPNSVPVRPDLDRVAQGVIRKLICSFEKKQNLMRCMNARQLNSVNTNIVFKRIPNSVRQSDIIQLIIKSI